MIHNNPFLKIRDINSLNTNSDGESFYNRTQFAKYILQSTENIGGSIFLKLATSDTNSLSLNKKIRGKDAPIRFHYVEQNGQGSTIEFPCAPFVDPNDYNEFNRGAPARNDRTKYYKDEVEMEYRNCSMIYEDKFLKELEVTKDVQVLFNCMQTQNLISNVKMLRDYDLITCFFRPYFPDITKGKFNLTEYKEGYMPLALRTVAGTSNLYKYSSTKKLYEQLATALPDVDSGRMSLPYIPVKLKDKTEKFFQT